MVLKKLAGSSGITQQEAASIVSIVHRASQHGMVGQRCAAGTIVKWRLDVSNHQAFIFDICNSK
jgi:hypothetical protein